MTAKNNTCKDCIHFAPYTQPVDKYHDLQDCIGFGDCNCHKIIDDTKYDIIPTTQCLVGTCDEQRAGISVGINFGCIHFEQK